jgi:hypothetical protein
MAYTNNGAAYSSAYSPSTCKVTATKMPAASGDQFIGTFSATLFKADHHHVRNPHQWQVRRHPAVSAVNRFNSQRFGRRAALARDS